jgi:hypothetical protein
LQTEAPVLLIEEAIQAEIEPTAWNRCAVTEKAEQESLRALAEKMLAEIAMTANTKISIEIVCPPKHQGSAACAGPPGLPAPEPVVEQPKPKPVIIRRTHTRK